EAFVDCAVRLEHAFEGWRRLLLRIARMETRPSAEFRAVFQNVVSECGAAIRLEGDDLAIVKALRAIFPPYRGRGLRLYRGDSAFNRRRRTYGISWTTSREVAEGFAHGLWKRVPGGSVLLETDAVPAAIIRVLRGGMHAHGREVWVDRRYL